VILDNAVVYHCHTFMADMGMGIFLTGFTVGRPARVGNTGQAADRRGIQCTGQLDHLADLADTLQAVIFTLYCHTRGVITAVFQPLQAVDQ
jgi:hypothetical protein